MPIPRVAIVGRPNVGKSSLMNMIAGAKVSIVDPTPGVTRDRVAAVVDLEPTFKGGAIKPVEFVDTGGFGVYVAEGERFDEVGADLSKLTGSIEEQIAKGIEESDLVLFAIDAQAGITPADREIARLLREGKIGGSKTAKGGKGERKGATKSGDASEEGPASAGRGTKKPTPTPPSGRGSRPPVRIVATKVDGPKWEAHAAELANLGFGEPLMVSAKSNYFRRDFLEAIYEMLPEPVEEEPAARADLQVAIIGKRNAGKSTLVNQLAGEPRVIVSEIAGTTRDAIDVRFEMDGKSIIAIDTAGLRRKRSFQNMIEHYAFDRVQRAVDRADVILVLIDATEKISQVDEQLAMLAQKAFKPVIIVVNKWDLVEGRPDRKGKPITTKTFETYVRGELKGLWFAPISFVSGETGRNVRATIDLAFEMREQASSRVTTGKLNRIVRAIMDTRAPTDIKGTFAKVFYVAQTGVEPPTITLVVNHPDLFTPNYMRFLMNRFREQLPFSEVPIRLVVRARRQREDDLASEGGPGRVARGRKGVHERTGARKSAPVEGEALLSDEYSEAVDLGSADEYFEDEE